MPQDTKQTGGNIAATQETFRGSYDEPRGGLLGGLFGGRDMRDDKPAVMPRTPMDRFGGMAPAIGGALLGPVGALGGLALQSRRYTGIRDMFDGGGAGKAGPTFQGGTYSGLLNALGVRPRGFRDRQAGILERQQAAPTTMAGAMGGGGPAVPAATPEAPPVTAQTQLPPTTRPTPYSGPGMPPYMQSGTPPYRAPSQWPRATIGQAAAANRFARDDRLVENVPIPSPGQAIAPDVDSYLGLISTQSPLMQPHPLRDQYLPRFQAPAPQAVPTRSVTAAPAPTGPIYTGINPQIISQQLDAYADSQRRLQEYQQQQREQRLNQLYPNMMVAP